MHRIRLAPLVALVAVAVAGCSAADADPASSPGSTASPSASSTPTTAPSASEEPWQTVTADDGATWSMPADWTTVDASTEGEVGGWLQVDVLDEDGDRVLSYAHDLGGLSGLGGACQTFPEVQSFAAEPSQAGFQPVRDEAFLDAAYAIEQADGSVVLSIGVVPDSAFDASIPRCLVYNSGLHPANGSTVSFATDLQTGSGDAASSTTWGFGSFDEARAFADSAEGQTLLQVVESLRLQP
ncbi:hypothetical protein [Agrococcus sp. SGAir0287]|uniref:hypothetical protein n=1 Tax=Agrococcus sp. SGAir0287 TaxID=2070347 RepID=UPI0010CCE014|nr:hypothetical protein [Agrococcus sp. SGAir0287]QCR20159.1 hypothetical protein C1N71_12510 [Agrococcus sp. SGAir0287]